MRSVPGRWLAAARYSQRSDIRSLLSSCGGARSFSRCSEPILRERMAELGWSPRRQQQFLAFRGQATSSPWLHVEAEAYPERLGDLPCPPALLFYQGDLTLLQQPSVGMVGARASTPPGRELARRCAELVISQGGVVISGGARGIDEAAQRVEPGRTILVMGAGLDARLSVRERRLRELILSSGGLILSELPPQQQPARWTFPLRNRIIAALSRILLVVEAGPDSGSLITARWALNLRRRVVAAPGRPDVPATMGCLELIREGVDPLLRCEELKAWMQTE